MTIIWMRYIFKVFFVFIVIWCLLNVYKSRETIFQTTEFGFELIIEYLIDLQLYIHQQLIKFVQSKFCNENCKIVKMNDNSDLSKYKEKCPHHRYTTRIIERSPLIIYIEQFINQNEIQHLIQLAKPLFKPSMVYEENGTSSSRNQHRTSSSAYINRHQTPIVRCIEQRFAQFQGEIDLERMEPLQVVKYTPDQQFKPHYDWFPNSDLLINGGQRVTTFFTYLESNCSMGETEFIDIQFNKSFHEQFCDILVCDENSMKHGIRFRPLSGNSIFWYNMDEHGQVDYLTYHAGHPPGQNGHKIGLNTWTRLDKFLWPSHN